MICPKCKKEIQEKSLKCAHCGARVGVLCKKCRAYNSVYNLNCVSCNNVLLKVCPDCKSVNFPQADVCRKCGHGFGEGKRAGGQEDEKISSHCEESEKQATRQSKEENDEEIQEAVELTKNEDSEIVKEPEKKDFGYNAELHSQKQANDILVKGILSLDKKIISLNGPMGIGKSMVLKSAVNELRENNITWLLGECSSITQLNPCGFIQNLLLSFFNITSFCSDSLKLKKESQKFFHTEFPSLTNDEIFNLLNFLYPTNTDYFENILINKEKTFTFLKKVFKTIIENNPTVLVVDNFELIDGLSYEFLIRLVNADFKQLKILLTYNDVRPAVGYMYSDRLKESNYLDISLNSFDRGQVYSFIDQYFPNEKCPDKLKLELFKNSGGNPAVLEQFVSLVIDFKTRNNSFDIKLPTTFNEVMKMRLDYLKESQNACKLLMASAIQGITFCPSIVNEVLKMQEAEFWQLLDVLQRLNFIVQVSEFSFAFKNTILWASIFEEAKNDESFGYLNENLFMIYSNYVLSSNAILAIIAQNLNQNLSALNIWTDNTKLAAYIGDTNLYTISQKQCLTIIDNLDGVNTSLIKNNIYERLGKLLSKSNPNEAIEYLSNAILNVKKLDNPIKEIELTGYLANCCISLGDYYGTIECVDAAIAKLDYSLELEIAMLKSRKLDALLNIGNSGEIVNLIDNEIMPIFDKYIVAKPHKNISINSLYKSWLQTHLALANALIFQGNTRCFEVLTSLFDIFEKNAFDDELFICKAKLALAFANTIKGYVENSEKILGEIIQVYKTDIMDNEAISRWNLINILNNFIHKKYSGLQEELFQVVTFANNINDNFTKNILKTLLGKLFKDEENAKKALDIYSEQITYFAKEKNGIGALLTWYLIADADLVASGPEKALEVAQKALDVAQSPRIDSYIFVILFNKVIAEAYMVKSEYEMAKVHIERAIMIARKFELLDFLASLYLLYGKYLQDIALIKTEAQVDYVMGASKMYKKATMIAQEIKNNSLLARIEKSKTVLNSFCQLNDITLKDS